MIPSRIFSVLLHKTYKELACKTKENEHRTRISLYFFIENSENRKEIL